MCKRLQNIIITTRRIIVKEITAFNEVDRAIDTGSVEFENKFKGQADRVREVNSQIKNGVLTDDSAQDILDNVADDILLQDELNEFGEGYDFRVEHRRLLNRHKDAIRKSGKVQVVEYKGCCVVCGKQFKSGDYALRDTYGEGLAICLGCCTESNKIDEDNELIIIE